MELSERTALVGMALKGIKKIEELEYEYHTKQQIIDFVNVLLENTGFIVQELCGNLFITVTNFHYLEGLWMDDNSEAYETATGFQIMIEKTSGKSRLYVSLVSEQDDKEVEFTSFQEAFSYIKEQEISIIDRAKEIEL